MPPVTAIGMVSIALLVAGGVYLASNIPRHVALAPAAALLAAAGATTVANLVLVVRMPSFAWRLFTMVAIRGLVAYVAIAGMIEYVFIYDHTRGAVLGVLTGMLAVFALNPPLIMAFTVARYQSPEE